MILDVAHARPELAHRRRYGPQLPRPRVVPEGRPDRRRLRQRRDRVDRPRARLRTALATANLFAEELVWSPDGTTLALVYGPRNRFGLAFVAAVPNARPRRVLDPARYMQVPVWSPDSSAVATTR